MSYDGIYCFGVFSIDGYKQYLTEITDIIDFLLSSDISDYEETRISFYEEYKTSVDYCTRLINYAKRDYAEGYFSPELTESLRKEFPTINRMYTELINKTEKLKSLLADYYERLLCDDNLLFNNPNDDEE